MSYLKSPVLGEGLGISRQSGCVPTVVTREFAGQVRWGLSRKWSQVLDTVRLNTMVYFALGMETTSLRGFRLDVLNGVARTTVVELAAAAMMDVASNGSREEGYPVWVVVSRNAAYVSKENGVFGSGTPRPPRMAFLGVLQATAGDAALLLFSPPLAQHLLPASLSSSLKRESADAKIAELIDLLNPSSNPYLLKLPLMLNVQQGLLRSERDSLTQNVCVPYMRDKDDTDGRWENLEAQQCVESTCSPGRPGRRSRAQVQECISVARALLPEEECC
ncbi:hypothetical protein LXL04_037590 [Taraxacum kok-saghyz]